MQPKRHRGFLLLLHGDQSVPVSHQVNRLSPNKVWLMPAEIVFELRKLKNELLNCQGVNNAFIKQMSSEIEFVMHHFEFNAQTSNVIYYLYFLSYCILRFAIHKFTLPNSNEVFSNQELPPQTHISSYITFTFHSQTLVTHTSSTLLILPQCFFPQWHISLALFFSSNLQLVFRIEA